MDVDCMAGKFPKWKASKVCPSKEKHCYVVSDNFVFKQT